MKSQILKKSSFQKTPDPAYLGEDPFLVLYNNFGPYKHIGSTGQVVVITIRQLMLKEFVDVKKSDGIGCDAYCA